MAKNRAEAFQRHVRQHPIARTVTTRHGIRYAVDGPLETTDRRNPMVRSVWVTEPFPSHPRLVTAYPLEAPDD